MALYKNCLKLILSAVLSVQSVAFAGSLTDKEKIEVNRFKDFLEPMGYRLYIDTDKKQAEVYDKNSKKLAMVLPFAEDRDLKKFSPKSLQQMVAAEMSKISHVSQASFSHSLKNLPAESAMFFMAMGAVMAGQLITNYSQNPIAMKQHIEHQLSPLGVFGFFIFMYSQGFTANMLSMYLKNPKFHHMIPYLGMTVGAFTQTYLSSILADPNVKMCAKQMLGMKTPANQAVAGEDPCEKAYEHLVLKKKIWEFAPGIASMLISAGLAGGAQALLTKAILRITGFDLAVWLAPGTMQVKGIRMLLVKGLQLSAFVAIDMWLNRKVTFAWKNFFDGREFYKITENLNNELANLNNNQWSSSSKSLVNEIKSYHTKMTDWRMVNMSEVYEAHHNWQEALKNLISMYTASYSYYNSFINEVRSIKYEQKENKALLRSYPFNGIKVDGLELNPYDMTLSHPAFIEGMQMETIQKAIATLEQLLKKPYYSKEKLAERKDLDAILVNLKSSQQTEIAKGLKKIYDDYTRPYRYNVESMSYKIILGEVVRTLGKFEPLLEPGRGFGITYEKSSEGQDLKDIPFYRSVGAYPSKNITDFMMLQMVCGPNIEQNGTVVKTPRVAGQFAGFPSLFLPPMIVDKSNKLDFCTSKLKSISNAAGFKNQGNIYTDVLHNDQGKAFKGFISYIAHNIKPSVAGGSAESNFQNWWVEKTDDQMRAAFKTFSAHYDEVVANMLKKVFNRTRSVWNRGPISNGLLNSSYQELRTYLFILESIKNKQQITIKPEDYIERTVSDKNLRILEGYYTHMTQLIAQIKSEKIDGKVRITSKLENYQLEDKLTVIKNHLSVIAAEYSVGETTSANALKLNDAQKELVVSVLEQIQSLASETMMYGTIANAVSWEKTRNLEKQQIDKNDFRNEVQEKLSQIRSMALPKM